MLERYSARVGEPVLDRHVDVAQLWRLACDAARQGEKWGQRKKSVSDAMESYYTQLRRDKRGAKTVGGCGRGRPGVLRPVS